MPEAAAWIVFNLLKAHFSKINKPVNPGLSNLRITVVLTTCPHASAYTDVADGQTTGQQSCQCVWKFLQVNKQ